MKITIEPTGVSRQVNGELAREWRGVDDQGVPVIAWVRMVSPLTHDTEVLARYAGELTDLGNAIAPPISFDIRKVL